MHLTTTLVEQIAARLKKLAQSVAVAESSTGGLISASLLAVPGASAYFRGGSVIYTLESRKALLGLSRADVEGLEPLTEAMVMRFAQKARTQLDTTWGIAELGVAGPTGARYGHPPGISVIGIDGPNPLSLRIETGSDNRESNMQTFTEQALQLLDKALDELS
jgi:nicotinamide-nucleotide amidase